MAMQRAVEVPKQVLDYLQLHHIITIATASFTGMPHAATTAYVSDGSGVYFSMQPEELTVRNIDANHFASFTMDLSHRVQATLIDLQRGSTST